MPQPEPVVVPIDKVIEANKGISRYHVLVKRAPRGIAQEGEIDTERMALHFTLTLTGTRLPQAQMIQAGDRAFGQHAVSGAWLRLKAPAALPDYLQSAIQMLALKRIRSATVDDKLWKVELEPDRVPPRDQAEKVFSSVFVEPKDEATLKSLRRSVEKWREMKVVTCLWISPTDHRIQRVAIRTSMPDKAYETSYEFAPSRVAIPPVPGEALKAPDREFTVPTLFLHLPSIQGWCLITHREWAARSIRLIQENDDAARYAEVYDPVWGGTDHEETPDRTYHPIVIGAHNEDEKNMPPFYDEWLPPDPDPFFQNDYFRDYHHFGGEGTGLAFDPLFVLRGCPLPNADLRYFSAREWACGEDVRVRALNRLTFAEAIRQYGRLTPEGKRNAYLMLGHVLHLFQDQAMPDHAGLVAHPGSANNRRQAYDEFHIADLVAAEAAAVAGAFAGPACSLLGFLGIPLLDLACVAAVTDAAYDAAYEACLAACDVHEVGYERLVKDVYSVQERIHHEIEAGIVREQDIETYFREMAKLSLEWVGDLSRPLGMGLFTVLLQVPAPISLLPLNPDIASADHHERAPYLTLTDRVAAPAIRKGAGLIQHFYEVVNPPPYVERLTVMQAGRKRFEVSWTDRVEAGRVERRDEHRVNRTLYHGIPATIRVTFGPRTHGRRTQNRKMRELTVSVNDKPMPMAERRAPSGDWFYESGAFLPGCSNNIAPVIQTIHIHGLDDAPHLSGRHPDGRALDESPSTVARLLGPNGPWQNYDCQRGYHAEQLQSGVVEAVVEIEAGNAESAQAARDRAWAHWLVPQRGRLRTTVEAREADTRDLVLVDRSTCGRYCLGIAGTVRRRLPDGTDERGSPDRFGLSCAIEDPDANSTFLSVSVGADAAPGSYFLKLHLHYVFRQGMVAPLSEREVAIEVETEAEAAARRKTHETMQQLAREMMRPAGWRDWRLMAEMGLLALSGDLRELHLPIHGGCWPSPPPDRFDVTPYGDVIYRSPAGEVSRRKLGELGLRIGHDASAAESLHFQADAHTALGTYLVLFDAHAGPVEVGKFGVFVEVRRQAIGDRYAVQ